MRHILAYALSLILSLGVLPARAQNVTVFSRAAVTFDDVPKGTEIRYRGESVGVSPCSVEVSPPYLLECDAEEMSAMSSKDIQAYNSSRMESYIRTSGLPSGIIPGFNMTFEMVMPDGSALVKTFPLMWEAASVLGMPATRIFYYSRSSDLSD